MDLKEFEVALNDAELRVERLRALYEQWFQGIERLEPVVPRKNLERIMDNLRRNQPQQTQLRFRYQNLVQRYTTYVVHWKKTARMIEEGTYRRDVLRARQLRETKREKYKEELEAKKAARQESTMTPEQLDAARKKRETEEKRRAEAEERRKAQPKSIEEALQRRAERERAAREKIRAAESMPAPPPEEPPGERSPSRPPSVDSEASRRAVEAARAARSSLPPARRTAASEKARAIVESTRPAAASPGPGGTRSSAPGAAGTAAGRAMGAPAAATANGLSEQRMRGIYDEYVAARKRNREPVDAVRYEKLASKVRQMMPQLQKKHAGKRIDFEVVVKKGRVALKPVAK
jgi:hypothetical protein